MREMTAGQPRGVETHQSLCIRVFSPVDLKTIDGGDSTFPSLRRGLTTMNLRFRAAMAGLTWFGLAASNSFAQGTPPPSIIPRSEAVASTVPSSRTIEGRTTLEAVPATLGPKAIAKVLGTVVPGAQVRLDGRPSSGGQVWYRWVQASGPRVVISGSDQPVAQFFVPAGATELGFVLVVGNAAGVDARAVRIAITSGEGDTEDSPLKADAGPDQLASVGEKVILDGSKSEPTGRVRFRWVQTGGPKPVDFATHGSSCSFLPEVPGVYQFALLVLGNDNLISDAAPVSIKVRSVNGGKTASLEASTQPVRAAPALDELARAAVTSIPGGARFAPELSRSFDAAAERAESAKTYLEAATDLTRRLDALVPREPARRAEWVDRFLKPWNTRMIAEIRENGLDLEQPGGQTKPLTKAQKARLADLFRITAAGLRAGYSLR